MDIFNVFKKRSTAEANEVKAAPAELTPAPGEKMAIFTGLRMHCAGCQALIEGELQEVVGTRSISVSLKDQSATVVFDPSKANLDSLRTAIKQAGYLPRAETVVEG